MHAPPEFRLDLLKLGGEPLLHGGPTDQKLPVPGHTAVVGEPEEVESFRLPLTLETLRVPPREAAEPDESRLLRMEVQ